MVSREEADIFSKKEEEKGSSNPPIVSSWAKLKDPRIVRVSRAFGGKDRHSKVCTVRGLRDRRVRLSVPTAIQLYDLQDRLGLNQPSKVVDWLLNAAKNEIDELPPLQIPPGNLIDHNLKSIFATSKQVEPNIVSNPWFSDTLLRNKSGGHGRESLDKDFFSNNHQSNVQQTGSRQEFMRWDSSNLSLAQSGMHDQDEVQNYNLLPFLPTHQLLLYQPPAAAVAINSQSYFVSNTDQSEAVESETIRLSQNRIGRDFESWFHLSTSSQAPPPPHDPKEHTHSNSSLPGFTQI